MKNILGLSLPELMVSIAVVSVVGAGMYVGFQQIDSAQQVAREVTANSNQTGLLLDLIEADTIRSGQGLDSDRSTCLVAPSGGIWLNTCNGDYVATEGVAHGLVTCRKNSNEFISSLFFVSGPIDYQQPVHRDLRCADEEGPFFDVYSVVQKSTNQCETPSLASLDGNLRTSDLCKAEFRLTADGANFDLVTSGRLAADSNGNIFSFSNKSTQTVSARLSTSDSLLETKDPYVAGFEQPQFFGSSASGSAWVRLDRPALEDLTINYVIVDGNGIATPCTATIPAGERAIEIPQSPCDELNIGDSLRILTDGPILADGITDFDLLDLASAPANIELRFAFSETNIGYGETTPLEFTLIADRAINWAPEQLTFINVSSSASAIQLASGTISSPAPSDSTTAGIVAISSSASISSRSLATLTPSSNEDLPGQTFQLTLNHASAPAPATAKVWLTNQTSIPKLFWLQNTVTTIRPIEGEGARQITGIIVSEPPPTRETEVSISIASGSCGTGNNDILIEGLQGENADCSQVTLPVGAERTPFSIAINEVSSDEELSSRSNLLTIAIASSANYIRQVGRDKFKLTIEDYAVPHFDLTTSTVRLGAASATGEPDGIATNGDFLNAIGSPEIGYASAANNQMYLLRDAASGGWQSGSIPISLIGGSSASTIQIELTPAAPSQRFRLGASSASVTMDEFMIAANSTPLRIPFWINNGSASESPNIQLEITRASGDAKARRPATDSVPSRLFITLVPNQCGIGDGMTIGDSRADHFHTVGLDDMTNANVTAATVRISSGYDSSTDRLLIDGITPTTAVNVTTYSGGSVTYNSTTYSGITAKFFTNQGVLEITRSTALPAPAMVKFFNESVYFQSTASGNSARSATFTLGDAQAWDMHEDGTTHYYRFVPGNLIQFNAANTAAASNAKRYFGVKGYLATVTSRAENTFLGEKFNVNGGPPAGWLGAWDNTEGTWEWMNGPEKGRRFLSGNTGSGNQYKVIRGAGNGAGTASSITRESYNQTVAINGSDHQTNGWSPNSWSTASDLKNMRYDEYSETIVNGRVTHPNNPYRFANFADGEPNDAGPYEDKLQMTGNSVGGRLWNDLPGDLNTITGYYASGSSPYNVSGYYQEFGGPLKSEWGFYNRKFSQTNNFTTGACSVTKSTAGVGLTQDSCEAWSDLTIGTGTAASSGFDFFGPNSSVSGQSISSARVSISSGYVSGTDELVIDGITANTSTVGQKKYLNFAVNYNGTNYDNIDAIFFINQGVMEITRYTDANGSTKATMPANAMVQLFNEKVEFVHDPSGNGLVSSSERQVTYTLGEAQAWFNHEDGGTRYYRYVPQHLTWWQARDAAKSDAQDYFGVEGYLATVTSKAENDFLADKFNDNGGPPAGWLNGRDWGSGSGSGSQNAQNEGKWRWVGGPESGRHFWKGNGTSGKFISGTGNNAGTENTTTKSCVEQSEAWNGHAHASGYLHRLNYGYTETLTNGVPSGSVGSTNNARFANWSCYNSNNGMEPNNSGSGAGEDFLQLNGGAKGGGMWNDLRDNQGTGTGVYHIKGYYIEYGGPSTYSNSFSDRRLGATFRINPQECALVRVD